MEGLPWRRRRAPPRAAARPPGDAGICALCLLTLP